MAKTRDDFFAQLWFQGGWHSFSQPDAILSSKKGSEVVAVLTEVDRQTKKGKIAIGFVAYEACVAFEKEAALFPTHQDFSDLPLVSFALFSDWPRDSVPHSRSSRSSVGSKSRRPLPERSSGSSMKMEREMNMKMERGQGREIKMEREMNKIDSLSRQFYFQAFEAIQARIRYGEVYQVNFTFPIIGKVAPPASSDHASSDHASRSANECRKFGYEFFQQIQSQQQGEYAAFLDYADFSICSASPECFFELDHGIIRCLPMKGTVARGKGKQDLRNKEFLKNDDKNRAENLMVVDLVRNDLGRIAAPSATVETPRLFHVDAYPQLWQMISEVTVKTSSRLPEIFGALFPSPSVTGAPKFRACQAIHEFEMHPRGIYCGAVGFIAPANHARFSTAIRTGVVDKKKHEWRYSVGSGITVASTAAAEYEECLLKGKVLGDFAKNLFADQGASIA